MRHRNKKETEERPSCCAFCEKATVLATGEYVLCQHRGVVAQTYVCRRFVYDPLKRIPYRTPKLPTGFEDE